MDSNENRNEIIESLKDAFPEKDIKAISKALDSANGDFEEAFQILLDNPESLEENQKLGIAPKTKKVSKRKKRKKKSLKKESVLNDSMPTNNIIQKADLASVTTNELQNASVTQNNDTDDSDEDYLIYCDSSPTQDTPKPLPIEKKKKKKPKKKKRNRSKSRNYLTALEIKKILESPIFLNVFSDSESDDANDGNNANNNGRNNNNTKNDDDILYSDEYEYEYYDEEEEEEDLGNEDSFLMTKRIDLHGFTLNNAKKLVEQEIANAKKNKIGMFHFITGKGHHSENHVPVLRPNILRLCQKHNVRAYLPRKNTGIIICIVNEPFIPLMYGNSNS